MTDVGQAGVVGPAAAVESASNLTREEYFAERRMLIEGRQRGYQRAEQMVIGGATGSLVLSITFLEKLVPAAKAASTALLSSAWLVLLACLSLSLFGQYSSARAFDCEIARLEAGLHGEPPPSNAWATCTRLGGAISAMLLVVGIALLALFAYINAPFHTG
jgi:hypothetical protein